MSLQIHNIRFRQKCFFGVLILFSKIMLESWVCGLYSSAAYTRVFMVFAIEILLQNNFWIQLNPRFSVPRQNLENSIRTPPFCFATKFEENGFSSSCDVYPGRLNISPLSFTSGWCHTHSKRTQKCLPEVLSAVEAISQI